MAMRPAMKMTRYQANKLILAKLEKLVEKYPNWRFNQILLMFDIGIIGDMFLDESVNTLERLEKQCKILNEVEEENK